MEMGTRHRQGVSAFFLTQKMLFLPVPDRVHTLQGQHWWMACHGALYRPCIVRKVFWHDLRQWLL